MQKKNSTQSIASQTVSRLQYSAVIMCRLVCQELKRSVVPFSLLLAKRATTNCSRAAVMMGTWMGWIPDPVTWLRVASVPGASLKYAQEKAKPVWDASVRIKEKLWASQSRLTGPFDLSKEHFIQRGVLRKIRQLDRIHQHHSRRLRADTDCSRNPTWITALYLQCFCISNV